MNQRKKNAKLSGRAARLEKARVNVWGEPLAKMLPHGLFDTGSQDEGASKLAAAGVTVDRDSPVARSPAVGE